MATTIQKWGNSQGLRFPKSILEEAQIQVGDEVSLSVQDGKIVVEPVHPTRGKYSIQELVARMPVDYLDYQPPEVDWGELAILDACICQDD